MLPYIGKPKYLVIKLLEINLEKNLGKCQDRNSTHKKMVIFLYRNNELTEKLRNQSSSQWLKKIGCLGKKLIQESKRFLKNNIPLIKL